MKNFYQKKAKLRINLLAVFFILWGILILGRLIHLQLFKHSELLEKVENQNKRIIKITPRRGYIYDCNEEVLATSIPMESIYFIPGENESKSSAIKKIKKIKEIIPFKDYELSKIIKRINENKSFIWIKRKVDEDVAGKLKKIGIKGIYFEKENRRLYPLGDFASHILGGVNIDEHGLNGIEREYDLQLFGKEGLAIVLVDAKKRQYQLRILKKPVQGKSIVLTIDETIQYITEKELAKTVRENHAKQGWAIVMNPWTGEILSLANYPSYNPNNYPSIPSLERNNAISYIYEPGSTFKIIPIACALQENIVKENEIFDCRSGKINLGDIEVKDYRRFSFLSLPEIIYYSSNVGAIKVALRLGEKKLFTYLKLFGFGQRTGIDLPGEEEGILRDLRKWSDASLGELSIGYEIGVTAIQMLRACSVFANGGYLVNPRIVKKIVSDKGEESISIIPPRKILTRSVVRKMRQFMEGVVEYGTGKAAKIEGYKVAGKTGTSQKIDESGKYSNKSHFSSFVGFAPAEDPVISMIIVIDDPIQKYYGGAVAAPCFKRIVSQILRYLKIFPSKNPKKELKYASDYKLTGTT